MYLKKRNKKDKRKKGDVHMQVAIDERMNNLKERAFQRRISFPKPKSIEDTKVENDNFYDAKKKMYEQITEDKKWN